MKLWIWSDLHLELQEPAFPETAPPADMIVCAGDLCRATMLLDCARWLVERYRLPMGFVPGNHEFYCDIGMSRTKPSDHLLMKQVAEASKDWVRPLHVLDDRVAEIGGVRFVGGTLWTDFRIGLRNEADLPQRMRSMVWQLADFSRIRLRDGEWLSPEAMLGFHVLTRGFIERQLAIVTHNLPHPNCTPAAYRGLETNCLFACSAEAFGKVLQSDAAPALWVCGHTHHPVDVAVGRTRVVCNPRGYLRSASERANGFRWDLVIDTEEPP
jgi:hypothetical protein